MTSSNHDGEKVIIYNFLQDYFSESTLKNIIIDLENYADLLTKWQKTHNLVSPSTLTEIWSRHIFDSVQLFTIFLEEIHKILSQNNIKIGEGENSQKRIITHADFGSGGGLPAIPLAILFKHYQGMDVSRETLGFSYQGYLVESVGKKSQFLNHCRRSLNLPIEIFSTRIEDIPLIESKTRKFDIISARALADLSLLFDYAYPYLNPHSVMIFPKGKTVKTEINSAENKWKFEYNTKQSLLDKESHILSIHALDLIS